MKEDSSSKDDGIKAFLCDYLLKFKKDNNFTYQDFKDEMARQGYKMTDVQLNSIFNKKGEGVSIEVIERILKCLDVMYKLEIYEREW